MKVFVITISDVYDFASYNHNPEIYADHEKARARLKDLYAPDAE